MTAELDLAGLKAMLAEATPGPLSVEVEAEPDEGDAAEVYVCHPATVCDVTVFCTMGLTLTFGIEQKVANAHLIVAAVNSLPALIQRIEALEAFAQRVASGEAFRCQRFAEDDDAEYFLRAQRQVSVEARTLTPTKGR